VNHGLSLSSRGRRYGVKLTLRPDTGFYNRRTDPLAIPPRRAGRLPTPDPGLDRRQAAGRPRVGSDPPEPRSARTANLAGVASHLIRSCNCFQTTALVVVFLSAPFVNRRYR